MADAFRCRFPDWRTQGPWSDFSADCSPSPYAESRSRNICADGFCGTQKNAAGTIPPPYSVTIARAQCLVGTSTVSIAWITPLVEPISANVTLASSIMTLSPSILIFAD